MHHEIEDRHLVRRPQGECDVRLYGFTVALEHLRLGGAVCREAWIRADPVMSASLRIERRMDGEQIIMRRHDGATLAWDCWGLDILASDWILLRD